MPEKPERKQGKREKEEHEESRVCYGPGCLKRPRSGSKYCSDDCGMNLAQRRIRHFLPSRLEVLKRKLPWAENKDREEIERIEADQKELLKKTNELYEKEREYHQMLSKAKSEPVDHDQAGNDEGGEGHESIYCVSCGAEVHLRSALRHIHRCFNKYERYFTGSPSALNIADVYCNRHNEKDKTYCKRLRVMCGEHNVEPVSGEEVCGFPLLEHVFTETGRFCSAPKLKCFRHISWDKFRQAELDTEKVKLFIRFRENMITEEIHKANIQYRRGLVPLLLHNTIDHDHLSSTEEKNESELISNSSD